MIALTYFYEDSRIYCPIQRCLRKMNTAEKNDYASQLSDYVLTLKERTFALTTSMEI
jgi:hypothetical protein